MICLIASALMSAVSPDAVEMPSELPVRQILILSGASCMEELDETELERYSHLEATPVPLNTSGLSRLLSCGLFSRFQAASIVDYRSRYGDILSIAELSLLDGFSQEYAEALEPFVSLGANKPPGRPSSGRKLSGTVIARTAAKYSDAGLQAMYGSKISLDVSDFLSVRASMRAPYSPEPGWPQQLSASAVYYGRDHLGKVVVGDFNARFGQGLLLWNGFTMSGFPSSGAFYRRASGISSSGSYTPTLRGIAADAVFGRLTISTAMSEDILPALNATMALNRASFGMTFINAGGGHLMAGTDGTCTLGRFHLFYEVACDIREKVPAFTGGCEYRWDYDGKAVVLVRNYPSAFASPAGGAPRSGSKASDEAGASFGIKLGKWDTTFDASYKEGKDICRFRLITTGQVHLADSLSLGVRFSASLKPQESPSSKIGLRTEAVWTPGSWSFRFRSELQHCESFSALAYLEAGHKMNVLSSYVRLTMFSAPGWNDRIYVYERDAPGNFNIPAYYGRGASASLYLNAKWKAHRLSLILSSVLYVGEDRGKCEARLQYGFTWKGRRRDR